MSSNHDHYQTPNADRAFAWAVALNSAFVVVEAGFGFATGSLALLADAAHNLTDVAGLLIAWGAASLSRRKPTARHTYGLGRATILAALTNAIVLLAGVGAIVWEAIQRVSEPVSVPAETILWVAAAAIGVNTGTALLFMRDRHRDLNIRGAFLHMATDAGVSAGVVVSALIVMATGWNAVDPIAAILVSMIVGWSAFNLFLPAVHLSLDGVPKGVDTAAVERWLRSRSGVADIHDLHIWALSTTSIALTAHLVMPDGPPPDDFLDQVADGLHDKFDIAHSTIQIERRSDPTCRLESSAVP